MATAKGSKNDQDEIRKLDKAWGDAASKGDVAAVVPFYAADGTLVWPGEKPHHGTKKIHSAWVKMYKEFANLQLRFTPERIEVSKDGLLASDFGKVGLQYDDRKKGRQKMTAKYLVVWKKVNGSWKVLYDSWNSNTPD